LSREKVERQRQEHSPAAPSVAPHLAFREKELSRKASGSRLAALTAWGGTAAVFFALGIGAVVKRDDVVRMFPEASSAYAMAGLEVNPFGLEFADVAADRRLEGTLPVLTVSGTILIVSDRPQAVPNVRVDLRDDAGFEVESILVTPEALSVGPGGEVSFSSRLDSPSLAAYDLEVTFVPPTENVRLAAGVPSQPPHEPESHAPASHDTGHATDDHGADAHHDAPAAVDHHEAPADDHHEPASNGHDEHH
ncbi:MAG TPA: hypothetical protein DDY27_15725, partial [Hyphomonadaceae bacterium]|nr:hypothetical protein [Hyphomonadaceae bacterium]